MRLTRLEGLLDVVRACTTEDDDVKQGIGAETVCAVHGDAGSLTRSIQSRDNLVFTILS